MDIWLGLLTATGPRDLPFLHGNEGVCVWLATQAEDADQFSNKVSSAMCDLGLKVCEIEEVQCVTDVAQLSDVQFDLLPEARRNQESVVCATWHFFAGQDA